MDIHLLIIELLHEAMLLVTVFAAFFQSEELCDLKVPLDDSSTEASTISAVDEEELKQDVSATTAPLNDLCGPGVYQPNSWTIFLYDRKHKAGDTVWCRIWYNEGNEFRECKAKGIFELVHMIIEINPDSCFYIKTVGREGQESVLMFDSNLIVRALTAILERAKKSSSIVVPKKEELLFPLTREKKKRGFLTSLRFGARGRKSVN